MKPIRLEPDVIANCQSICDGMLDQLKLASDRALDLTAISGFGTFPSALELQSGYQNKFTGDPTSLVERLKQYTDAVIEMRAAFSEAGAGYSDSDNTMQQRLTSLDSLAALDSEKA
ncbi:MAG: hypothetical protein GX610_21495 [Rhodococcus sp.]|nr:hypothetical protein [Rhodococcus sp. (in: high G+C Gram-positive bacteria)]